MDLEVDYRTSVNGTAHSLELSWHLCLYNSTVTPRSLRSLPHLKKNKKNKKNKKVRS